MLPANKNQLNLTSFIRSIRGQIMMWTIILGIVPVIIVGGIAYITARNALETKITDGLEALVETKSQQVETWITDTAHMIESMVAMDVVRGDDDEHTALGLQDLISYSNSNDEEAQLRIEEIYNLMYGTIESFRRSYPRIDQVFILDTNGVVQASTWDAVPIGTDIVNMTAYGTALDRLKNYESDTYISDLQYDGIVEDEAILITMAPIMDYDNQIIGYAAMRTLTDRLQTVLGETTGLGKTGETYIVDAASKYMLTPSRLDGEDVILSQVADTKGVNDAIAAIGSTTKQGRDVYKGYHGDPILGVWHIVEEDHIDTTWVLLGEMEEGEAFSSAQQLLNLVLGIIVVSGVVIVAVVYYMATSIAKPITSVTDAAVRLSEGQLDERVAIKSKNEVGVLADAFNSMASNLQNMVKSERESKEYIESTVSEYMTFVEGVAQGNLMNRIQLKGNGSQAEDDDLYKLGLNLNAMVESLAEMAQQFREVAATVTSAATEIQAATAQQSASAIEQDASVAQTVATLEEVRQTILQTAQRANEVAAVSQESVEISSSGETAVKDTMNGMELIRERVESIAETILALSERTQQIGEIIDTVNGISDQSKLLALNASIEAARAGEEGKGFAVVAMEVRQLAEQSRDATARVRDILNEIQQATNTAVMVTEEGSKGADGGMVLVERAGEAIRNLAETIEQAAQSTTQIAASTHQQTNGVDQLQTAMQQIKQASTQTAASTRQTEESVRNLVEMAQELNQAAERYQL